MRAGQRIAQLIDSTISFLYNAVCWPNIIKHPLTRVSGGRHVHLNNVFNIAINRITLVPLFFSCVLNKRVVRVCLSYPNILSNCNVF